MKNTTHNGFALWLTGLSGSGKSSISSELTRILKYDRQIECLDGDLFRDHFSTPIGFSRIERKRNIETAGLVAKILSKNSIGVISSFITPYQEDRKFLRENFPGYIEVYLSANLHTCEQRDVKGLYKKARAGEIKGFTGIDDPYEIPENPDIEINTGILSLQDSVKVIINYLVDTGYMQSPNP